MKKLYLAISSIWAAIIIMLPDEFSKYRVRALNRNGCCIHPSVTISPNVRIRGSVSIGQGSSIAQNCTLSGGKCGIKIGSDVMIAPNVVIVAFTHGFKRTAESMSVQPMEEESIVIEDDVWVAANCTISKGVRVGAGTVVSANSLVVKDLPPYSISGGVPAIVISSRIRDEK